MKFRCTAWLWKDGYVMVDGDHKTDRLPDSGVLNEARPVILQFEAPDNLWDPQILEINAKVELKETSQEARRMLEMEK
ncbi:MAG: hypothetical protein K6U80_02085 [Firmicutes bacterium]|nr:hypothetical protein [Bacillota bacterium]